MRDPHELQPRVPAFQHDAVTEEFLRSLNEALVAISLPMSRDTEKASELPIIYIVGAPRSGTTLLSQLISRHLEVGYIDNVVARFWLRPSVGIRLSQILLGDRRRESIEFHSEHGVSSGLAGPHEFGYFWRHWLKFDTAPTHHPTSQALSSLDPDGLRAQLHHELLAVFRQPTVFKNVICGFYAAWLSTVHPRSVFVHIERDVADTAASILATRYARYGAYDAWWSLKPSTFGEICSLPDPAMQVVRQVIDCRREFATALGAPSVRALTVRYSELCAEPHRVLELIGTALHEMGVSVTSFDAPAPFRPRVRALLPADLQASLDVALRQVA